MINQIEIYQELQFDFDNKTTQTLARIFAKVYEDMKTTVTRQEFSELHLIVKELAEAQKRTERKLEQLAEAQIKTEKRVDVLSERVEGVSNTFGYALENITYKHLPSLLLKEEGIKVQGKIIRKYYERKGNYNQINIFAKVTKDGKDMLMLGEVKTHPSKIEIDRFLKIVEHIKKVEGNPEVYLVFVAHDYHPKTEVYLQDKGIRYFWSYDVDNQ